MKRILTITAIFVMCCVLCSCGNGVLSSQKSTITFELPVPPVRGRVSNSREVTFEPDDYYVVTCKNTASGTVIYNQTHTPGTTVTINNVAVGSYEVTASLYRKDDEMSLFRNSFVKSSSATATCTVKARETTAVNLNMPYPALCGWRMTEIEIPVPYYGVDNCFITYQGHSETGYDYWFTIMKISEEPSPESCSITVSVDGESATDTEPCIDYDALRNTLMFCLMEDVSKPTYQKIEEAVTANKDFTVTAVLDGDQYILTIPSDFYSMCDTYDAMVEGGVEIENYSTDSWFIGIGEDACAFFFKDNPRLVVFLDADYSAEDTNNGTESVIDSMQFGTSGDTYTDLLFSQPDEEGDYTQGIGTYFDSVDNMKASLSKALTSEGFTMKFTSDIYDELNFETTLIAETAEALADWLGITLPGSNPQGGAGQTPEPTMRSVIYCGGTVTNSSAEPGSEANPFNELSEAVRYTQENGTIYIHGNITTQSVIIGKNVTINGNNNTITGTEGPVFTINNGVECEMKNIGIDANQNKGVVNQGTLTFTGGWLENYLDEKGGGISSEGTLLTISDFEFKGSHNAEGSDINHTSGDLEISNFALSNGSGISATGRAEEPLVKVGGGELNKWASNKCTNTQYIKENSENPNDFRATKGKKLWYNGSSFDLVDIN